MPIILVEQPGPGSSYAILVQNLWSGDIGAKFDAEVTRTGLSADEIGTKVLILYHASTRQTE